MSSRQLLILGIELDVTSQFVDYRELENFLCKNTISFDNNGFDVILTGCQPF